MPLKLLTGLPGNGKTSFLVSLLMEKSDKRTKLQKLEKKNDLTAAQIKELHLLSRLHYVCGIEFNDQLNLNIQLVEYDDIRGWWDFEIGSLIIVDEAQNLFPARTSRDKCPDFITKLSEHRHRGFDFILLTQDPRLLDTWVRRLIDDHSHIKRVYGTQRQVIFKWDTCCDSPRERKEQSNSQKKMSKIDKKTFGVYESAAEHTIESNVPTSFYYIGFGAAAFVALGFYLVSNMSLLEDDETTINSVSSSSPILTNTNISSGSVADNVVNLYRDFIDLDIIFIDSISYGDYLSISLILIQKGMETPLSISDLKAEEGLQFSLLTPNKLMLKQNNKKRVLYRTIRPDNNDFDGDLQKENEGFIPESLKNPFSSNG